MKSKQNIFLGAVVLLVLMAFAGSAQATTTLTVDDSGGADYLTITGALNVANDGDTIIVAAGTYAGFTVDEDVDVHGAQYNVDPEGALYRGASDDSDESVITGTIFLTADGATVNGFKLTSSYIAAGYPQAHDITISYNILENVGADWGAIHLHGYGTIDVHQCDGAYIGYNSISGAVGDGIWTVGNDDVTIEYNHILSSSGQASIQAINHVGTGIVIHGNTITDSNGKGINYWADNGGVITDNVITNSNNEAIFTDVQATISGNQITGTGGYGILVIGGAAGSIVSGNTISNPSYEGIQSDVQVSITNNDISGGSNGIQLSNAASGSVIDGNTISAPSWIGIKSFVPVDITNNNIIGGWGGIEILSGAGGSTMSGNTVSGTAAEAFRIFAQAAITNNDISGGYSGIGIWADGTVIDSNNIHDNQCRGVSIDSSVNNAMIRNNQLINNPYPGVTVWGDGDGSGIDINYNEITGNGIYGVESQRTISDVNAEYNWWGDASGPVHSTNPVGMGNAVSDNVDYSPWLGFTVGTTPMTWHTNDNIQDAIDEASGDDTIIVAAGTYYEVGQIVIDKNLAIIGADKVTTIIKPNHDTSATTAYNPSEAWIYVIPSVTFALSEVTLDGTALDVNPRIIHHAIQSRGELTVEDCIIKNIKTDNIYYGRGIVLLAGESNTIARTEFSNIQRIGIHVRGSVEPTNPIAFIEDITYVGKGNGDWLDYGIEFGGGGSGIVDGADISACTGVAYDDSTSAGILATDFFGIDTIATVVNSIITGNTHGIAVGYVTTDETTLTAHCNDISGNIMVF